MTTNTVLVFLVFTWNKINTFQTSQCCCFKLVVPKFQKYQRWQIIIQINVFLEIPFNKHFYQQSMYLTIVNLFAM